jgi:hypothetical protein
MCLTSPAAAGRWWRRAGTLALPKLQFVVHRAASLGQSTPERAFMHRGTFSGTYPSTRLPGARIMSIQWSNLHLCVEY